MADPTPTPPVAEPAIGARRPINARNSPWAASITSWLVARGITPNEISLWSIACAMIAAAGLIATDCTAIRWIRSLGFLLAAAAIQLRLLCNLFDGMVAVEGAKTSKSGEIFNDFPDRISDPLILVAAGYATGNRYGIAAGWTAAVLAVMTAYARVLGRSLGAGIYFLGPMAKQHRMAVITAACLLGAGLCFWRYARWTMFAALVVIDVGCVVTIIRRTIRIVADLEAR